jgi:hypothetical protein
MFFANDHRTIWVTSWDDVEEIGRPSHFQQKTMVTIFFNRTGKCKIVILPQGHKMKSTYFIGCIIQPLVEMCSPDDKKIHEGKVMLHFDNAVIHNAKGVHENLTGVLDSRDWNSHPIS